MENVQAFVTECSNFNRLYFTSGEDFDREVDELFGDEDEDDDLEDDEEDEDDDEE